MRKYKYYAKRGLALLIALVMCMGMLPLAAFAEGGDASDEREIVAEEVTEPAGEETQDPAEVVEPVEDEEPAEVEEPAGEKTTAVEEVRMEAAAPQMAAAQAASSLDAIVIRHTNTDYVAPKEWWAVSGTPIAVLYMENTPKDGAWFTGNDFENLPDTLDLRTGYS